MMRDFAQPCSRPVHIFDKEFAEGSICKTHPLAAFTGSVLVLGLARVCVDVSLHLQARQCPAGFPQGCGKQYRVGRSRRLPFPESGGNGLIGNDPSITCTACNLDGVFRSHQSTRR